MTEFQPWFFSNAGHIAFIGKHHTQSATTGETERATASEALRQQIELARPLVSRIILRLKGRYAENLAQLEGWGLHTIHGTRGVNVRKPSTSNQIIAFLRAYVAKESSLVEGQQIADPPLSTVENLLDEIENALLIRMSGRDQRELGNEQRGGVQGELLQWLQLAGMILVRQNGGTVSTGLQLYGFTVVERPAPVRNENDENPNGAPPLS